MKKTILTAFTAASLLIYSTPSFAELFSVSAGVPFSHSFADTKVAESDGVGGVFPCCQTADNGWSRDRKLQN